MLFFVSSSIVFSLLALLYALCMLLCALLLGVVNIFDLHLSKKKHLKNNFKKVLEPKLDQTKMLQTPNVLPIGEVQHRWQPVG